MKAIDHLIQEIKLWNPKDISYTKLFGGLSNENFLIQDYNTNKKYVLKMPLSQGALANRTEEILVNKKCAAIALSPPLLYVTSEQAFVTEYIEGESLTADMLQHDPSLFHKCMDVVKQFHTNIEVKHNNFAFDFVRMQMGVKEKYMYNDVKGYQAMLTAAKEIEKSIGSQQQQICACHNDLIMANFIIDTNGKCWLVDFEWSGNNELYYDLAKFSLFTEIEEEKIVQAYFQSANDYQIAKVYLYKMLNSLLVVQWCALQQEVSTLGLNETLYELGKKHFDLFFAALNNQKYKAYSRIVAAK